ncbi:FecR domain-containing protein [Chryseolinea sp. T2]|uniref:FecR family protein n=1 Tax=Chryseolinea sp. T2 TaxID=3129255 RepID=UPI0030775052
MCSYHYSRTHYIVLTTDYSKYQVEDFVADPYFIKWVKSPEPQHIAFWTAFLSRHPACTARVDEARQIVLQLDFSEDELPEGKVVELWDRINQAAGKADLPMAESKFSFRIYYRIAAALLLLALTFVGYYRYIHTITIRTTFGESRALFLPDSTKVTLNSNSELRYRAGDFLRHRRTVALKGEGFFAVTHQSDESNFVVHTEELDVEVLGTKFNVNSRRGKTQVVLQEGKVKLDMNGAPVVMKPGELVEFSGTHEAAIKRNVDTDNYSAWRNNRLVFSRKSLKEIAQLLEDNYGYKVVLDDAALNQRNFTGTCSSENVEELFEKLSIVFDLDVSRSGNVVTIQSKKEKPKQPSLQ